MDFRDLMTQLANNSRHILSRSPLFSTHWHIERDCFVNMGACNAAGYVSLNFLRELDSRRRVKELKEDLLLQILNQAPQQAFFYSLHTGEYIVQERGKFYEIQAQEKKQIIVTGRLRKLIMLDHVEQRIATLTPGYMESLDKKGLKVA